MGRFVHETLLAAPPRRVFELVAAPRNLDRLTPRWIRFRVRDEAERLEVGAKISYRLLWHGLPLSWESEIESWEPPTFLRYRQTRGPYGRFVHEQTFEPIPGGTRTVSTIDYRVPLGFLGRWLVERDLRRLFAGRTRRLREVIPGSPSPAASGPGPSPAGGPADGREPALAELGGGAR